MKKKLKSIAEELSIIANIAIYAAVCGAAWEIGKSLCSWLLD